MRKGNKVRVIKKKSSLPFCKGDKRFHVRYDNKVYIGKVVETDLLDKDARITFMERTRGKGTVPLLKWPSKPDEIWVDFDNIICLIEDALPYGRTRRQFKLTEKDLSIFANL